MRVLCCAATALGLACSAIGARAAKNARGKGSTMQVWEKFTTTFVASAATTTLSFLNGDPAGDEQNGLDQVTLVAE